MLSGRTASGLRNILSLLQGPLFMFSFTKLTGYKEANSHTKTEAKPLKLQQDSSELASFKAEQKEI